jgi:MFS family permease
MLPNALASGVMMPIGGRLFDKVGARPMAFTGLTVITGALFMFSKISIESSNAYVMFTLGLMGAGMGFSMMPVNTHVLQSAPRHLVTRVTPLTTAAQQVMVSFAVAGMAGFLSSGIKEYLPKSETPLKAMVSAYSDTFLLAAGIAVCGALLAIILRKPKLKNQSEPVNEEAKSSMMVGH